MKKEETSGTISAMPQAAHKATPTRRRPAREAKIAAREQRRSEKRAMQAREDERLEQEAKERAERRRERRAQSRESRKTRRAKRREANRDRFTVGKGLLVAMAIVVLGIAIVYPSARTFYITERNNERLAVELATVQQRNDAIAQQIEVLSTDEGIEDAARTELGWVKSDEEAVVVSGIDTGASNLPATVNTSTIAAPTTWYTRFLDIIFFTDTSRPVVVNSLSGDNTGGSASTQLA